MLLCFLPSFWSCQAEEPMNMLLFYKSLACGFVSGSSSALPFSPPFALMVSHFLLLSAREREREIYQSGMRFIDWSVMVHVCFLPPQHNLAGNCSKALPSRYSLMRVHRWCGCVLAAICSNVTEIDRGKILIYRNPPLTWNQNFRSSIFTGGNFPLFTVLLFISRIEIRVSDITLSLGLISIGLFSHVLK